MEQISMEINNKSTLEQSQGIKEDAQISASLVDDKNKNEDEPKLPSLVDTEIKDENTALNVMVSFLYLAQKRGAFNLQESSKVWECVQLFMKQ